MIPRKIRLCLPHLPGLFAALCICAAIRTDPGFCVVRQDSTAAKASSLHFYLASTYGARVLDSIAIRDPLMRVLSRKGSTIPGGLWMKVSTFPGVEAVIAKIQDPVEGTYLVTGATPDSTMLTFSVAEFRGRTRFCDWTSTYDYSAGAAFSREVEYRPAAKDSCRIRIREDDKR